MRVCRWMRISKTVCREVGKLDRLLCYDESDPPPPLVAPPINSSISPT
jgi:hypothetical protein